MKAYRLGLIGYPLGHSLSPRLHAAALEALHLEGEYNLYPLPPTQAGMDAMRSLFDRMRLGELHGLNATIPHKKTVIPWLDELTPAARAIGAVNTIWMQAGKLTGDNTDCPGFLADLARQFELAGLTARLGLSGRTALILGAGGSARAVAYGLLKGGWKVRIAARRPEQAQEIAQTFAPLPVEYLGGLGSLASLSLDNVHLIVNTTPLGMQPQVEQSPWPDHTSFPGDAFVYDLVYNPPETSLLRSARLAGLPAANGLGMLVSQAVLSFRSWTGLEPPWEALYQAAQASAPNLERKT